VSFVSFVFVSFVFVLDVCGWMMLVLLLEEWIVCLMDEVFVCLLCWWVFFFVVLLRLRLALLLCG